MATTVRKQTINSFVIYNFCLSLYKTDDANLKLIDSDVKELAFYWSMGNYTEINLCPDAKDSIFAPLQGWVSEDVDRRGFP